MCTTMLFPLPRLLLFSLCLIGTRGTRCTAGQFNRNSGVREVTNDVGLAVLTVAGELRAVGSHPPAVAAQQRAVLLGANRKAYASVFHPTAGSSGDMIVAWGHTDYGADASGAAGAYKVERVFDIRATESGFAALISLKPPPVIVEDVANVPRQVRAIAWGNKGGNLPSRLASAQVESLHSTSQGFAATLPSGEIVTWGHCDTLGEAPSLVAVSPPDRPLTALAWAEAFCAGKKLEAAQLLALGGATSLREAWAPTLQSPPGAVAVAPGKTLWWWTTDSMLTPPSSVVNLRYRGMTEATSRAFAAITEAGGVVAWGDTTKGGEVPGATAAMVGARASRLFSNLGAFMVTTIDGGAFSWGDAGHGGGFDIPSGVVDVASTETAFALLFRNSTVIVIGGDAAIRRTWWVHDVKRIIGQRDTFAGVQRSGRIVTWGGIEASIKTVCQDCTDDTWSNDDATQCLACDGGYWSSAGSAKCQPCVLGICQRHVLGGMLGFASLILICCGVCMCDVADEQGF